MASRLSLDGIIDDDDGWESPGIFAVSGATTSGERRDAERAPQAEEEEEADDLTEDELARLVSGDDLAWLVSGASKPHGVSRPHRPKILFLDVDGVLNTNNTCDMPAHDVISIGLSWPCLLSRPHLRTLKGVLDASGCDIVLSSTWRLNELGCRLLQRGLRAVGIPCERIVGATPDLRPHSHSRPDEILAWLSAHGNGDAPTVWAAVDDIPLERENPEGMRGRCVLTKMETGLDDEAADACVRLLNS